MYWETNNVSKNFIKRDSNRPCFMCIFNPKKFVLSFIRVSKNKKGFVIFNKNWVGDFIIKSEVCM